MIESERLATVVRTFGAKVRYPFRLEPNRRCNMVDSFSEIAQRFSDTDADMQQRIEHMANAIAEFATL